MSEPEEVILDGAHAASTLLARVWRPAADADVLTIADCRRRLDLLVVAA